MVIIISSCSSVDKRNLDSFETVCDLLALISDIVTDSNYSVLLLFDLW